MTVKRKEEEMAGVSDLEVRQMKKFMSDSCFTCTDEWLVACMNWIKAENNGRVSLDTWKRELSDQWKDANLEEMESSCLPRNLASQKIVKLPGKYGLQVNTVRDIGESSYSQWTRLKKLENENTSVAATDSTELTQTWEPKAKRCLYLTMTDGSQQVFGLEMQYISALSLNMKPGFKVIIHGPVDCRRGVIHLKQNNVRVIGGEVEDLLEANRVEKILADTLKLTCAPSTQTQQSNRQMSHQQGYITANREDVIGDFPDSEEAFPDVGADDDIFMEIDEEALLHSASTSNARSTSQMTTQRILNNSNSTVRSVPEEMDESLMRIVDETLESKLLESYEQEAATTPNPSFTTTTVPSKTFPVKLSASPFIYLAQVQDAIEELKRLQKVVLVKACVSTIVSNIQVDNGSWTLSVCLNDGTGYLDCNISANILTDIIGFTPAEMKKIKAAKTKEGKRQIAQGMGNLAKELVHLNAVFSVEISDNPMIIEIIDLKLSHSAALKSRLFQIGL